MGGREKLPGIAIVGFGYWGPNLTRNFFANADCRLVAIYDRDSAALDRARIAYPSVKAISAYEDVLSDDDIDAVVIATPVSTHYPLVDQALDHGKDVLVEKPLSENAALAEKLVTKAEKLGRILAVDHTFLFNDAVCKTKELMVAGEIGEALYIDSVRINLGLFRSDVNVVNDLAPHDLSLVLYLLDMEPTHVSVSGMQYGPTSQEALAYIHLMFSTGVIAHIHVSWLSPVKVRRMVIAGTKKMIIYDDLMTMEKIKIYDQGVDVSTATGTDVNQYLVDYRTGDMLAPKLALREALDLEVEMFIRAVGTRHVERSDGQFGLSVMRVLDACQRSLEDNGAKVAVRDVL